MSIPRAFRSIPVLMLLAAPGAADYACESGLRPLTAAEQAFYARAAVLHAALPQAPKGWEREPIEASPLPEQVCKDFDAGYARDQSLTLDARLSYTQSEGAEERVKAFEAAASAPPRLGAFERERLAAIEREIAELSAQIAEAAAQQDVARAESLGTRLGALVDEKGRLTTQQAVDGMQAALHDTSAQVEAWVNSTTYALACSHPQALKVAGAAHAFRACASEPGREPYTVLLFGPFELTTENDGYTQADWKRAPGASHAAIHTIVVEIRAAAATSDALLARIDLGALARLVSGK